jgi:hypothetical protein
VKVAKSADISAKLLSSGQDASIQRMSFRVRLFPLAVAADGQRSALYAVGRSD